MKQIAGMDIGNGYVKALVSTDGDTRTSIDVLSGVGHVIESNDIKTKEEKAGPVIDDLFNQLDASFDSNLVKDGNRRLFGKRGIASGLSLEEFDVASTISKVEQNLSGVLVLGLLSAAALQKYYKDNKKLPTDVIKLRTNLAIALPITEYKRYRKRYAESLGSQTHYVTIHNFETPVRVEITFSKVNVLAEGASAQFAIVQHGEKMMKAMLKDLERMGEDVSYISPADIIKATNTLGIDIGEGTVNFPVFTNGVFNTDASGTFNKGYGTVLGNAVDTLKHEAGLDFKNRKSLVDFMLMEPNSLTKKKRDTAKIYIDKEARVFSQELVREFSKIVSRLGAASVDVIYIYGGGATPLKEFLQPMVIDSVKSMGYGDLNFPILYLDSAYSRFLNREGLYLIAESR